MKDLKTLLNNICSSPSFNSTVTKDEMEKFIDTYSLVQFCNGRVREINFEEITPTRYKIFTIAVK